MIEKTIRKSYCIVNEIMSYTFIKPLSGEYDRKLIMISEDAFGMMEMKLLTSVELANNSLIASFMGEILDALEYNQTEKELFML